MDLSEGSNDSKSEVKDSRRSRDRESKSHRDRDRERDRRGSKSRSDHHHNRRDRDRKSRRSPSRERRRSRSPRRSERESRHSRSRSRSRERSRKYTKRYERKEPVEKNDRQKSTDDEKQGGQGDGNRFFMPGITGRFRDQIERRKQLWQKKDDPKIPANNGQTKKVWEATTFAQDTDGKVASKFKRLMGIRNPSDGGGPSGDGLRKQEEMFSSMEQQYEVARTATHTMRGVGLGFGSFQR